MKEDVKHTKCSLSAYSVTGALLGAFENVTITGKLLMAPTGQIISLYHCTLRVVNQVPVMTIKGHQLCAKKAAEPPVKS